MILRTGRRQGRNLYMQCGPEPSDRDVLCGQVDTPELARLIVAAVRLSSAEVAAMTYEGDDALTWSSMTADLIATRDAYRTARSAVTE